MGFKLLKRLYPFIKPYLGLIILSLFLAIVSVFATITIPLFTKEVINNAIGQNNVNWTEIYKYLIIISIENVLIALSTWFMNLIHGKVSYNVAKDIRCSCYNHIQTLPLSYLDSHPIGDILSRLVNDVELVSDGLILVLSQFFTGILTIVGTIGFMFYLNVYVALLVVLLTPLSIFVANFIAKTIHKSFKEQSKLNGVQTSLINEGVTNQKTIQAYNYEKQYEEKFINNNNLLRKTSLKAVFVSSLVNPSTRFINNIVYASTGVLCAYLVLKDSGSLLPNIGLVSAFLSYASTYVTPFNNISETVSELQNASASMERIDELLLAISEPIEQDSQLLDLNGDIIFNNISFSYNPNVELIKDFNFTVKNGETIAIVGPTGAGKTTLINLLLRFYELNSGSISMNGNDFKNISKKQLRNEFGMVLQDTWLFSGTIRDNLIYGNESISEEEMIEACKLCHCHSFITKLENGYDTCIGEDGGSLSNGQKQLLCIARVMIKKPSFLILDEATSSIDTRTEIKVQKAFEELMKNRTTFIVAHRLSTIEHADKIIVMNNGHIVESGSHQELLGQNSFYKSLYESQFKK